ncbi:MAG TPA: cadmium-translocating P-type ATPase [Betaproteobacteria bacterium]|nr:cadmium-translocating P-type ATPase [Betaproteobacteria bacterium]
MRVVDADCFHCGLPVPPDSDFLVAIEGVAQPMCCRGCQAVAQAIIDNGLQAYYQYRTEMPESGRERAPQALQKLALYDRPEIQKSFVITPAEHLREATLILEGITCAACIWLNERHLQQLPGVKDAHVNYSTRRARVSWDERELSLSRILQEIQLLGYTAHPYSAQRQQAVRKRERQQDLRHLAVAALCTAQVMMLAVALYAGAGSGIEPQIVKLLRYASLLLTLPVIGYAAVPFYKSAFRAILSRRMNMDVPVTLAIGSAFIGSTWSTLGGRGEVYFDAVTMFCLFLLATRYLERNAREKSTEAVENLLKLAPAMAVRIKDDVQEIVPVVELENGDMFLVKPGESVAADGAVIEGESTADESLLTGESRAIAKGLGDTVIAGSINLEGPLRVRVTGAGENTVLAGIVRMLDRAQSEKPKIAQMADRLAGYFTYGLLVLTALTALAWWWVDPQRIFEASLAVLVATCPCALSLAAPAAFAAASSRLLRRGVLLTRGHALETSSHVNRVVFDKTGTLTYGKPCLQKTEPLAEVDADRCLAIAASLEQASEHPLAASFLAMVDQDRLLTVEQPQNTPGKGVNGVIGGIRYALGNRAHSPLICGNGNGNGAAADDDGVTDVWLCDERRVLAKFSLSDALRPEAVAAVRALRAHGLMVTILSGDSKGAVSHIAHRLGVEDYYWGMRPEDKLAALKKMQCQGEVAAMVGDGVNDAPVLAGSQLSIAMGGGAEVARASSDIVLLTQRLGEVWQALETGRASIRIMHQNFMWAVAYNMIVVPFAALGMVPPWLAALGMSVSSLVVVTNALRLREGKLDDD